VKETERLLNEAQKSLLSQTQALNESLEEVKRGKREAEELRRKYLFRHVY
jgi:hypothetical protein